MFHVNTMKINARLQNSNKVTNGYLALDQIHLIHGISIINNDSERHFKRSITK